MDRRKLDHDDLADDVPAFLLGALDAGTCDAVSKHLDDCPTCKEEGRRINEAIGALGVLAPSAKPPADLRGRFLSSLQSEEPPDIETETIRAVTPLWIRLGLIIAVILVVIISWIVLLSR